MSDGFYEVDAQGTEVTDGHGDGAFAVDAYDNQGDAVHGVQVTDAYGDRYTEVDGVDGSGNAVVYQEYDGYVGN